MQAKQSQTKSSQFKPSKASKANANTNGQTNEWTIKWTFMCVLVCLWMAAVPSSWVAHGQRERRRKRALVQKAQFVNDAMSNENDKAIHVSRKKKKKQMNEWRLKEQPCSNVCACVRCVRASECRCVYVMSISIDCCLHFVYRYRMRDPLVWLLLLLLLLLILPCLFRIAAQCT